MDTIKNYLETLFIGFPQTDKVQQAKEELLGNMEDHYWALIDEGKSENEAIGAVISEFGSVEELKQVLQLEEEPPVTEDFSEEIQQDPIELPEVEEFLGQRRKIAAGLSTGISITILAVSVLIFFGTTGAGEISLAAFFVFIAIGVGLIIYHGLQFEKNDAPLLDRLIRGSIKQTVKEYKTEYQKSFQFCIVLGVTLCILSIVPLFLFSNYEGFNVSVMLAFIACGTFLFVYGGVVNESFEKFLKTSFFIGDDNKLGPNARREKYGDAAAPMHILQKCYWPIIVVIYLAWSFFSDTWAISWVIFVVAGILWSIIESALKRN